MKKFFMFFVVASLLALALSACASGNPTPAPVPTGTPQVPTGIPTQVATLFPTMTTDLNALLNDLTNAETPKPVTIDVPKVIHNSQMFVTDGGLTATIGYEFEMLDCKDLDTDLNQILPRGLYTNRSCNEYSYGRMALKIYEETPRDCIPPLQQHKPWCRPQNNWVYAESKAYYPNTVLGHTQILWSQDEIDYVTDFSGSFRCGDNPNVILNAIGQGDYLYCYNYNYEGVSYTDVYVVNAAYKDYIIDGNRENPGPFVYIDASIYSNPSVEYTEQEIPNPQPTLLAPP